MTQTKNLKSEKSDSSEREMNLAAMIIIHESPESILA